MANSIIDPKDPDYCERCGGECVAGCTDAASAGLLGEKQHDERDFDQIADAQGWNADTLVMLLREYIANQHADDALDDFARQKAAEENGDDASAASAPRSFMHAPTAAFMNERPWCGWMLAFAAESDWDTTGFGLEKLMSVNFLLTTADGRSRPVRMKQWQWIEDRREGEARAHVPAAGIEVVELDADNYEPLTPERRERVRYEDIREIVVF